MYVLATIGDWADRRGFERRAVRAIGRRGQVVSVLSGVESKRALAHNRDRQVAAGARWVLWWDPPNGEPEPIDGVGDILRSREAPPQ